MKFIVDIPEDCIEDLENIGLDDLNEEVVLDIVCCVRNGISLEELSENPCLTCGNNCCNQRDCEYRNLIILKENKE